MIESSEAEHIRERIEQIQERIDKAAQRAGRNPAEIELIAVTKEKSAAVVKSLSENGITKIGESYLREALFKIKILSDYKLEWHMIGNIQHGKETQIALNFAEVHSVDRLQIAETLNKKAKQFDRILPVYLEFNVSGEDTKHGWSAWKESQWEQMLPELDRVMDFPSLEIKGLMTMAPYSVNPEDARPIFQKLRKLGNYLSRNYPAANLNGLSMGMSGDFETAIEEGATVLRIGSALVGHR
jgi:pyridoxal phosphate enzyme (YggS family)